MFHAPGDAATALDEMLDPLISLVAGELRLVKRELRKDIDRLDGVLKFFNIAAVPLLIGFASVGWAYRRRRTAAPTKPGEEQGAGASHDA